MKSQIKDIYKVSYQDGDFDYAGTLRNEKKFEIGDSVFFAPSTIENAIVRGKIIGVELEQTDNPSYLYKILITSDINIDGQTFTNIECDRIFVSMEEAKQSAIDNCRLMYELELKKIESYFNQFTK